MSIIYRLHLSNFRCHENYHLEVQCPLLVLIGPNGIGKTSLLESLSMLSPGRGLRNASGQDLQMQGTEIPWRVMLSSETSSGPLILSVHGDKGRRKGLVNQTPLKSQLALVDWISVLWPLARWQEGLTHRRAYLNRLLFTLDPTYGSLWLDYEKALKQRYLLLMQGETNQRWYESIEYVLAEKGFQLFQQRLVGLEKVTQEMKRADTPFAAPTFHMTGQVETALEEISSIEHYLANLSKSRALDILKKGTSFGVHKTHFSLLHPNGRDIALCSMGEQTGLLLSVILAVVRLSLQQRQQDHYLLLDEVMAYLDDQRQKWLWQELSMLKAYVLVTGLETLRFPSCVQSVSLS